MVFLRADPQITVVPQLHQIGVKWQEKRSAAPASPGLPLRVVLLNCLLNALQTRVEELLQNPLKLKEAQERMLVTEDGNLNYMSYDVSNHKHQVEKAQAPIPLQQMVGRSPPSSARPGAYTEIDRQVSCNQETLGEHAGGHPPFHARGVNAGSCSPKGLRPLRHPLPPGSVAPCGRLSPPRTHSEDTSSAGRGAGYPLMALRLGNRSNYCYANSLVVLLMFVGSPSHAIFPAQLAALFNRLVASPGKHLWDDLIWRSLLAHGRRPSQQNDVAEFATHLFSRRITCHPAFTGQWQARIHADEMSIRDTGGAWPLVINEPTDNPTHIQALIRAWHTCTQQLGRSHTPATESQRSDQQTKKSRPCGDHACH